MTDVQIANEKSRRLRELVLAPEILVMPGALRDTLTAHGAPELTAVYCQGDDILFEALPPSITRGAR